MLVQCVLSWVSEELSMRPTLSYLLLHLLHRLLIMKPSDGETMSHNFDDGLAVCVDEVRHVERVILRIYLHLLVPVPFVFLSKRCMPHKDGVGVCHQYAF